MNETTISMIIGENIAFYRNKRGFTQSELSEKVGVTPAFISRVERGEKKMKIETLIKTADALGISCDALLKENYDDSHISNIRQLLADKPLSYWEGIEAIVRVCVDMFEAKSDVCNEDKNT